jgi:4-amino-4-deoxy-L-arabinose transferase-like glycosyltransferase
MARDGRCPVRCRVPPMPPPAPTPPLPPSNPPGTAQRTAAARLDSVPWLLALLAFWLLATLGVRPLLLPDEGRYAEVARAMLGGDPIVPRLDGLPFFHKPPLFYWIGMAAMRLFGPHAFGARFGSALGAWLMGAALLLWMRHRFGTRTGTTGLAVLATTPFFFLGAQYANHDMLVGGLVTAAVLALARAVEAPSGVDARWQAGGWALCALAVLAKGLIGFVLPALVIAPWLLARGRWRQVLGLLHPRGLLLFALIAAPWFVAMQLRYPGFFDYFVVEQHFRRFAQTNFNNVHGAWFFLAVMPLLTLPWSGWLPRAVQSIRRERNADIGLCVWWLIAVIGFFSIPSSKLVGYALPALAPWCALLALAVARPGGAGLSRAARLAMLGSALGGVAIVAIVAWKAPQSNRELSQALAQGLAPGDNVVMVDEFFYDVPFYARLTRPVKVASRWSDPDLPRHDNWRKELFDAAAFEPARGGAVLLPLAQLANATCGATAAWFIVRTADVPRVAGLPGARAVYANPRTELWRVPGRTCP